MDDGVEQICYVSEKKVENIRKLREICQRMK